MSELILLRGAMGSGKTTYAKELLSAWESLVRVNRDDLRDQMFNTRRGLTFKDEDVITYVQRDMVQRAIQNGRDVVVDDMHLRPKYIRDWYKFASKLGVDSVTVKEFPVPVVELLRRNESRPAQEWIYPEAITNTVQKFVKADGSFLPVESYEEYQANQNQATIITPYVYDPNLNSVILVDIDGTVAKNTTGRGWFDWDRVGEDSPNKHVLELLYGMAGNHDFIFLSGRSDACRNITEQWLSKHGLYGRLLMREAEDRRPDTETKLELFNRHIRGKFNVQFVLDDRPSVCRMWRELGLDVLQVGDPYQEF